VSICVHPWLFSSVLGCPKAGVDPIRFQAEPLRVTPRETKIAGTGGRPQVQTVAPMRVSRAMPLVLGSWLAVGVARAQPEGVPAIFSDVAPSRRPAVAKLEVPEMLRPRLPLSPTMRAALNERATAQAAGLPLAVRSLPAEWSIDHGDAIVMERYVVNELARKKVKPERDPNPIYHAFSTGDIWVHSKWRGLPQIYWSLGHVHDRGDGQDRLPVAGASSTSPRAEIRFSWPF
jgi:hypothetical protein